MGDGLVPKNWRGSGLEILNIWSWSRDRVLVLAFKTEASSHLSRCRIIISNKSYDWNVTLWISEILKKSSYRRDSARRRSLRHSKLFNVGRQSCRAFIGLTIHAKMIGRGRPLLPEILDHSDRVGAKSPNFDLFSLVALKNLFL